MNRYIFSVVRFVPDPARGEFVNVGAVVGSEETNEWEVRQVSDVSRAKKIDEIGVLPAVTSVVESIQGDIDSFVEAFESVSSPGADVSERWLEDLVASHSRVVQFSPVSTVSAESIEHALQLVFDELVTDRDSSRAHYVSRATAKGRLKRAYLGEHLRRGHDLFENARLISSSYFETVDFVVANGKALQIAQTWSFSVKDPESVSHEVFSWAWTIRHALENGLLRVGDRELPFTGDIDLEAIFVPPLGESGEPALRAALSVFEEIEAKATPMDRVPEVAERARALLHPAA